MRSRGPGQLFFHRQHVCDKYQRVHFTWKIQQQLSQSKPPVFRISSVYLPLEGSLQMRIALRNLLHPLQMRMRKIINKQTKITNYNEVCMHSTSDPNQSAQTMAIAAFKVGIFLKDYSDLSLR
jgi:hypothetical protein